MALIKKNGNYVKVDKVILENNLIYTTIYEDKKHRQNGDNEFKKAIVEETYFEGLNEFVTSFQVDEKITIPQILKKIGYAFLRKQNEFSDCNDDLTEEQKGGKIIVVPDKVVEEKFDTM